MYPIRYKKFSVFYAVIVLTHLFSIAFFPSYIAVTKPLIVASLIGFYISSESKQDHIFLLGLIFALIGDIFLMVEEPSFFILGLASFLIMQLCYFFVFRRQNITIQPRSGWLIAGTALISALFLAIIWEGISDLQWPVSLYVFSIFAMVAAAITRNPSLPGYRQVLWGAFSFMLSDALLAVDKFSYPMNNAPYMVMLTYALAQYLIVTGIVVQKDT